MARMGENLYFPPAERPGLHFQARGEILFGMDMDLMCSASPQNALRVKKKVHSPPQMRIALANHPESHNLCRSRQQPPAPPSSLYYERQDLIEASVAEARNAQSTGWDALEQEHRNAWQEIWDETDVSIEGDPEAQQGIRYNIFQLYQTYRGDDPRLNIGPKGFTGEKYGGNTYWNTELCCVHPEEDCRKPADIPL